MCAVIISFQMFIAAFTRAPYWTLETDESNPHIQTHFLTILSVLLPNKRNFPTAWIVSKHRRSVKLLSVLRLYWYFFRPKQQGGPLFRTSYLQASSTLGGSLNQQPEDAPNCNGSTEHAEDMQQGDKLRQQK